MPSLLQALCAVLVGGALWALYKKLSYRSPIAHIRGPEEVSPILNGFAGFTGTQEWKFLDKLHAEYGSVARIRDVFGSHMLYIQDPGVLNHILARNEPIFQEKPEFIIGMYLLFGPGILTQLGAAHKKHRKMLSPLFSSGNLRRHIVSVARVSDTLRNTLTNQVKDGAKEIDMLQWSSRTMLEMAGQTLLGSCIDPLVDDNSSEFAIAVKGIFPALQGVPFHFLFAISWIKMFGISRFSNWLVDRFPSVNVNKAKNVIDTFWSHAQRIVDAKIDTVLNPSDDGEKNDQGDALSMLIKANSTADDENRLSHDELVAEVTTIVFGSVEMTTCVISRLIHAIAVHPETQQRLREEIVNAGAHLDGFPYERLSELPFLDAVYREGIRLYPPTPVMSRVAMKDTVIPLWRPVTDTSGKEVNEIAIDKGTTLVVGVHSFNRNPDMWGEDSHEWKPERWLSPLPDNVRNVQSGGAFGNVMTFMGGPRGCIGFKFAEIELKMLLCRLLPTLRLSEGKHQIVWNTSRTVFPTKDLTDPKPSMPLKIELIEAAA